MALPKLNKIKLLEHIDLIGELHNKTLTELALENDTTVSLIQIVASEQLMKKYGISKQLEDSMVITHRWIGSKEREYIQALKR